jgi:O-antigen/teichoic acid export membrane protein
MDKKQRIIKNTLWLSAGKIASGILTIAGIAFIARRLGPERFGTFTLALTLGIMFGMLVDFGMSRLTTREVARLPDQADVIFINGLCLRWIIFIGLFALAAIAALLAYETKITLAILSALFGWTIHYENEYLFAFFYGHEKMGIGALGGIIQKVLFYGLSAFLIHIGFISIPIFFLIQAIMSFIVGLFIFVRLRYLNIIKQGFIRYFSFHRIYKLFKQILPFGLFSLASLTYMRTDTILLSLLSGQTSVGYYQAAMRLIVNTEMLAAMVAFAIFPSISRDFIKDRNAATRLLSHTVKSMLIFAAPLGMGICIFSRQIINFLYGSNYKATIPLLSILALIIPIRYAAYLLGTALMGADRVEKRAIAAIFAVVISLILSALLIPRYGAIGAAVANVMASAALITLYAFYATQQFNGLKLVRPILLPIILSAIAAGVVTITPGGFLLHLSEFVLLYLVLLLVFRAVNKQDFRLYIETIRALY